MTNRLSYIKNRPNLPFHARVDKAAKQNKPVAGGGGNHDRGDRVILSPKLIKVN